MDFKSVIRKKRDGFALSKEELEFFSEAAARELVPDYQLSALLMAIYLNGLDERETAELTIAMAHSGDMADLSEIEGIKADKHSTGGVGDKTTLIVAPIVASCGVKIAKMSGRGLGHTGGTVDKLESIPGFKTSLPTKDFIETVNRCSISVIGQSGELCPADKKLYALRDVTETVGCIPLIASSIMSKKLAGGADCIVLDVKCGSGAFMKDKESATVLAEKMVEIGKRAGKKIAALITDMDIPLGNYVGNSLEIKEAVEVLNGRGADDLKEVALCLASKILELSGKGLSEECRLLAESKINDGSALRKLMELVENQGGNAEYIRNTDLFEKAAYSLEITAPESGFITKTDTTAIGMVCVALGAGRQKKEDSIDPTAGIIFDKKTGDKVAKGERVATLYSSKKELLKEAKLLFESAVEYGDSAPEKKPLVLGVVE